MNIRMSTKGKRPLRSLTPSDKIHAIQRIHDGESKASVARDIGVPESTLRGWCKNEDKLRFMSRQSASDKMAVDSISEKLDRSSSLLSGPPEKRSKLDSLPLNFSNKMKFDELTYKRLPLNGLDYTTNKALSEFSFNGLVPEYGGFNGAVKSKMFGADISRQADPSMAAISPLSSLTHLSGITGLSQSPLAMSFNELTSNLNLLAQLNPNFVTMSGINGLAATANSFRNIKPKISQQQINSSRTDSHDRQQQLLSVKNWAKQHKSPGSASTSSEANSSIKLTHNESKNKMKCPSPSLAPSIGSSMPTLTAITEDPLLYWLKSQQAMLGLNNLYQQPHHEEASTPVRSSTPQQQSQHKSRSAAVTPSPLTPSSTPSGSLDDKNSAWFTWCKAFGASLNSMTPTSATSMHSLPISKNASSIAESGSGSGSGNLKPSFENILYSHLTKDTDSPSALSSQSSDNTPNSDIINNTELGSKPEDLSAKSVKSNSPLPTPAQSPTPSSIRSSNPSPAQSPTSRSDSDVRASSQSRCLTSVADCKDVLDNLLYKINNTTTNSALDATDAVDSVEIQSSAGSPGLESDASYNSESNHNNNDVSTHNNNNNSAKTDEEASPKTIDDNETENIEAIEHGEKFLQWLEKCSNPRVTAMQLMQLRFLISAIKSTNDNSGSPNKGSGSTSLSLPEIDDNYEDVSRNKVRRRK